MIECRQSHHVDYAQQADLPDIVRLHAESQRYTSGSGTPYVKPLSHAELERLLPQTLLLKHRGIIIGKLHAAPVPEEPATLQIGGFAIGENHQDSQQGQLLLSEALARLRSADAGGPWPSRRRRGPRICSAFWAARSPRRNPGSGACWKGPQPDTPPLNGAR